MQNRKLVRLVMRVPRTGPCGTQAPRVRHGLRPEIVALVDSNEKKQPPVKGTALCFAPKSSLSLWARLPRRDLPYRRHFFCRHCRKFFGQHKRSRRCDSTPAGSRPEGHENADRIGQITENRFGSSGRPRPTDRQSPAKITMLRRSSSRSDSICEITTCHNHYLSEHSRSHRAPNLNRRWCGDSTTFVIQGHSD